LANIAQLLDARTEQDILKVGVPVESIQNGAAGFKVGLISME
jgi:hypothetical protein